MNKFATQLIGASALLVLGASIATAADKYPPGPSYRSCADSVTIFSVEQTDTIQAPCHPATLDTVLSVRGVIVGFDPRGSAFGFYIQNGTGPWTGVDIFTGAFNYLSSVPSSPSGGNLVLGDSVSVDGRTQEFPATDGTTEIEGPDGSQSTNDIVIRKVGHTSLPPIASVSVHNLEWLTATSPQGEAWEGCLVKIIGPLKVGRTSGTGVQSSNYLVTTAAPSPDSVLIDGFTLTSVAASAPAVGTVIDSIYGIVNQNTGAGISSYRVQIRGGNDVFLSVPPTLGDAYSIEDNKLRLVFDRNLDPTTAQNAGNYSLASGIDGSTVDSAVMETIPGNVVDLNITSVRTDGDLESVTVTGVGSANCPSCVISPGQTRSFVNGVLTIAEIQQPDPANLPLFDDRSRFAGAGASNSGTKLSFRGIGVTQYGGSLFYIMDENGQQRGGVSVFGPTAPILPGHRYEIAGQVQEFFGETEVVATTFVKDEGVGTIPAANVQPVAVLKDTTTDMTQTHLTGEDFEGMLVKVSYVRVTEQRPVGSSYFVAGPNGTFSDTILVSNFNHVLDAVTPPDSAHTVDVTGILHFDFGTFRICPRNASDIVDHGLNVGVDPGKLASILFAVSPNPARTSKVAFAIPRHDHVSLGVYDLQGRQVAQLANGSFAAGTYSREWSGLDAAGNRVHSGVYFFRLKVGNDTRVLRGVLLQ